MAVQAGLCRKPGFIFVHVCIPGGFGGGGGMGGGFEDDNMVRTSPLRKHSQYNTIQ